MGFPWRQILNVGLAVGSVMVPQIGIAEAAIQGLKKGETRRDAVLSLAKIAPQIAKSLADNDLHIHDQETYEKALAAGNEFFFLLQKATTSTQTSAV